MYQLKIDRVNWYWCKSLVLRIWNRPFVQPLHDEHSRVISKIMSDDTGTDGWGLELECKSTCKTLQLLPSQSHRLGSLFHFIDMIKKAHLVETRLSTQPTHTQKQWHCGTPTTSNSISYFFYSLQTQQNLMSYEELVFKTNAFCRQTFILVIQNDCGLLVCLSFIVLWVLRE